MENESHEPQPPIPATRACSTPHSAPLGWLKAEPASLDPPDPETEDDEVTLLTSTHRRDGWTPFARRLFLEVLAETGRVSRACDYAQLTKQSAYALRSRDPLFAAGWDAACELARAPLADALYEQAVEGVTETIRRNGQIVAERHRFDSRLSIAVLHRLDKRCDRAADLGSGHLALVRNWDEWLGLVGKGEDEAAQAILDSARHSQLGQLPLGGNPTGLSESDDDDDDGLDLTHRCWRDGIDNIWLTDFPPPAGFTGYENRPYEEDDDDEEAYERACTPEEAAILNADIADQRAAERAEDEDLRDEWFAALRAGLMADEDDQPDGDPDRQQLDEPAPAHAATDGPPPTIAATCKNRRSAAE